MVIDGKQFNLNNSLIYYILYLLIIYIKKSIISEKLWSKINYKNYII